MKRFIGCLMTLSFLFVMGGTAMSEELITTELIINGGFETGIPEPWGGLGALFINDGTQTLPIIEDTVLPISGDYDLGAFAPYSEDVKSSWLVQLGQLPVDIVSANVSWSDRILSTSAFVQGVGYLFEDPDFEPGQEVVVAIVDLDADPIIFYDVFRTDPVDEQYQVGPNDRSFDLTTLAQSLEGQPVALFFLVSGVNDAILFLVDDISLAIERAVQTVEIDIKPGSDPNCFNINGHGVIPVAILGSADLDVSQINVETLSFAGLEVRVRGNKGPLCSTEDLNEDTIPDLVCHFEDEPENWTVGTESEAELTGELLNGTLISGTDAICIVP
jgi:hypothetical protein